MEDHRVESDNRYAATIPQEKRCERCDGTGNEFMFMYHRCPDCGGTGRKRKILPIDRKP